MFVVWEERGDTLSFQTMHVCLALAQYYPAQRKGPVLQSNYKAVACYGYRCCLPDRSFFKCIFIKYNNVNQACTLGFQ